jgi:hypothetical protein
VLGEHGFHPGQVLPQLVGFAKRLLVVVRDGRGDVTSTLSKPRKRE